MREVGTPNDQKKSVGKKGIEKAGVWDKIFKFLWNSFREWHLGVRTQALYWNKNY